MSTKTYVITPCSYSVLNSYKMDGIKLICYCFGIKVNKYILKHDIINDIIKNNIEETKILEIKYRNQSKKYAHVCFGQMDNKTHVYFDDTFDTRIYQFCPICKSKWRTMIKWNSFNEQKENIIKTHRKKMRRDLNSKKMCKPDLLKICEHYDIPYTGTKDKILGRVIDNAISFDEVEYFENMLGYIERNNIRQSISALSESNFRHLCNNYDIPRIKGIVVKERIIDVLIDDAMSIVDIIKLENIIYKILSSEPDIILRKQKEEDEPVEKKSKIKIKKDEDDEECVEKKSKTKKNEKYEEESIAKNSKTKITKDDEEPVEKPKKNVKRESDSKKESECITKDNTINQRKTREKIPGTLRNAVWCKYVGPDKKTGKCFCCSTEMISTSNFQCGHIISEKEGGEVKIDNLRPICGQCNTSIGTKNMYEFMKQYGFKIADDTESIDISSHEFRTAVWIKHSKKDKNCFIGCDTELTRESFYPGLLTPEKEGGSYNINNVRMLCKPCNDAIKECGILKFIDKYELQEI